MGMCHYSGRLYTVEGRDGVGSYRLAAYSVTNQDTVTLLDTLDLGEGVGDPRVDHHSGRVYIACGPSGVCVVRYDGSKLVPVTTLRCVGTADSLAIVSTNTLYVIDWDKMTVSLIDDTQDRVTTRLQLPQELTDTPPDNISVLGDTVLVGFDETLVLYRHGVPTPGKVMPRPQGLKYVTALSTDHHSSFLVSSGRSHTVSVLDVSGNLTHTIPIPGDRQPRDCTVVGEQLWVGCDNGDIIVMSSQ